MDVSDAERGEVDVQEVPHAAELEAAYDVYRSATSTFRAAYRAGQPDVTDRAAERLLVARVGLYRALLATGWHAPAPVVVQLERDAALLAAPRDFNALLAGI